MYVPVTGYCTELRSTRPVKALKFGSKLRQQRWFKKKKTLRKASDQKLEDAVYLWFVQKRSQGKHYYYYYYYYYYFILYYFMIISVFAGYHLQIIS